MGNHITLKKNPKIEFELLDSGFRLNDELTHENSGFYSYDQLKSVEINKPWFPRLAGLLRVVTWVLNGVPYFPDAETCKKANMIIHFQKAKLGLWLTDPAMANKARRLKELLDKNAVRSEA